MKVASEFRDPAAARALLSAIARTADQIGATRENPVHTLEICGGHTHSIFRCGLDSLIHEGVEFIHGPGCPVCVLPMARVDECVEIAGKPGVIFCTFGDAMRVPGHRKSLMTAKAEGGKGGGLFITTAGVGVIAPGLDPGPRQIRAGDAVIVNDVPGDHGAAILAARGDLALSVDLSSDCAGLGHLMQAALAAAPDLRAARDCTRGGLASALNELAAEAGLAVEPDETRLPLRPEVSGVCETLGLDPLYLANEGRQVLFCPPERAEAVVAALRALPHGTGAWVIGRTLPVPAGRVTLRLVDMLIGEQLPRIC